MFSLSAKSTFTILLMGCALVMYIFSSSSSDNAADVTPSIVVTQASKISEQEWSNLQLQLEDSQQQMTELNALLKETQQQNSQYRKQIEAMKTSQDPSQETDALAHYHYTDVLMQESKEVESTKRIMESISQWQDQMQDKLTQEINTEQDVERQLELLSLLHKFSPERISTSITQKLLENGAYMSYEQQAELLSSLENGFKHDNSALLSALEPLLFSYDEDVHEEAFLRLQEIGLKASTQDIYNRLSYQAGSEWIRQKAKLALNK